MSDQRRGDQPSESPFLQACRGRVPARRPVWLMRQAGRILPPYRRLKEKTGSILTLFRTPDLAAEVTLMPVEMLHVDAAILFADILTPMDPMGCPVSFQPGPVMTPIRTRRDVEALRIIDSETDLAYVAQIISLIQPALPAEVPLIGFAGSPFTLAAYLAEGGTSKDFTMFRRMFRSDPDTAHLLMSKLTDVAIDYLSMQVRAGVQAVQLFDTWIGLLSASDFRQLALPYLKRIFGALKPLGVPRIYFGNGAGHFLSLLPETGADVLSLDWRIDLAAAFRLFGAPPVPLQGNLDPCVLFGSRAQVESAAREILAITEGCPHIFNLGHGVQPDTPYDNVKALIDTVHAHACLPEADSAESRSP